MCYLLKKYFWWLLRRVKNLRSTACKHYRKCDVIYRYLHIELIWCLLMVQYLQNNVIMKWTTHFIRFTGWIPLKYGSTTTPPIIAHCQKLRCHASYFTLRSQNLQYKTHPEFWPSHRRIFKTSLYYKTRLILETRRYVTLSLRVSGRDFGYPNGRLLPNSAIFRLHARPSGRRLHPYLKRFFPHLYSATPPWCFCMAVADAIP